jgi:hypothetical protein
MYTNKYWWPVDSEAISIVKEFWMVYKEMQVGQFCFQALASPVLAVLIEDDVRYIKDDPCIDLDLWFEICKPWINKPRSRCFMRISCEFCPGHPGNRFRFVKTVPYKVPRQNRGVWGEQRWVRRYMFSDSYVDSLDRNRTNLSLSSSLKYAAFMSKKESKRYQRCRTTEPHFVERYNRAIYPIKPEHFENNPYWLYFMKTPEEILEYQHLLPNICFTYKYRLTTFLEFIHKYADVLNWSYITYLPKDINLSIVSKYADRIQWGRVDIQCRLPEWIFKMYDCHNLQTNQYCPLNLIQKNRFNLTSLTVEKAKELRDVRFIHWMLTRQYKFSLLELSILLKCIVL